MNLRCGSDLLVFGLRKECYLNKDTGVYKEVYHGDKALKLECLGLNLLLVVLNLFMPSFLRMKNGDNDSSNLIGLLRKLNELILSA